MKHIKLFEDFSGMSKMPLLAITVDSSIYYGTPTQEFMMDLNDLLPNGVSDSGAVLVNKIPTYSGEPFIIGSASRLSDKSVQTLSGDWMTPSNDAMEEDGNNIHYCHALKGNLSDASGYFEYFDANGDEGEEDGDSLLRIIGYQI